MKTEQWKELKTIDSRYEISDKGNLRKQKKDGGFSYMKGGFSKSHGNYHYYHLNGKKYYAHRLVMLAFHGDAPNGQEVDHINRNTLDNNLENLRYLSRKQNRLRGEDISNSKLNDKKVKAILYLHAIEGITGSAIARLFKVSTDTIYNITKGKTWNHVPR